jgi:hypothetical protein
MGSGNDDFVDKPRARDFREIANAPQHPAPDRFFVIKKSGKRASLLRMFGDMSLDPLSEVTGSNNQQIPRLSSTG